VFKGFTRKKISVDGIDINCVHGGSGPPLLLLHGCPQNVTQWAKLAPLLADRYTVVCGDLRGYGDSSKPQDLPDHSNYAFRAMAADQVGMMRQLGFDRFHVAGHDRGGRVAHRMALDWPAQVKSLSVLDIVPTYSMYMKTDRRLAATFWQWYFFPIAAPFPELAIGANPDLFFENCLVVCGTSLIDKFDPEMVEDYRRCWRDPGMHHGTCSDYRAGASIDLEHDAKDLNRKVECPVLTLWAGEGLVRTFFDFEQEWKERASSVRSVPIAGGHFFPEQQPRETADALLAFLGE
jgi:haloacetate dehalogenase